MKSTYKKKQGRIVALILTHACNLNCVYCFEKHKSDKIMTLETAQRIVSDELERLRRHPDIAYVKFDLFGGEPLLRFDLIRKLVEWTVENFHDTYYFSVTTNGTLLSTEKRAWFEEHKSVIELILSVDGKEDTQLGNRGCHAGELPIDFVARNWPEQYLKMTVSSASLPHFAENIIYLHERGYRVSGALAVGVLWRRGDDQIYKRELEKIADYYLSHPDVEPAPIFYRLYGELLVEHLGSLPLKNCGTGTTMIAYDVDGREYPCHMFVPLVHGKEVYDEIKQVDFTDYAALIHSECRKCGILKICRTCYGFNYNDRGDVTHRDKTACRMFLAEAQVVSAFLIRYFMRRKDRLDEEQLVMLKGALKCYEMFHDYEFEDETE